MKKKGLAVIAVSVALMMAVAGCGSSSDDEDTTTAESTEESTEASEETDEEILAAAASMDEVREELLADIEDLVTLGEYNGVAVTITATVVTDEEVEAQIEANLEDAGEAEQITEGTVAEGDTVNIDYVGTLDGEEFDGGSAEGAELEIGSGSYVDGFEDGLVGVAVGDTVELTITFPDDYDSEDLAGQETVFTVTVNYILGDVIPAELTDDWVAEQEIDDVSTTDEYTSYIRAQLEETAAAEDEEVIYTELMATIIENATINGYSADLDKDELTQEEVDYVEEYADYYGMTVDEVVESVMGMTYDEYLEQLSADIDSYFDRVMIYRAVIYAEGMEVDQEDYEEALLSYKDYYSYYGYDSASALVADNSADIYENLLNTMAEEFLINNADVTKN